MSSRQATPLSRRMSHLNVLPSCALTPWRGPTLRQFVARAERSFGDLQHRTPVIPDEDRSLRDASRITGLTESEHPSPATLRLLCSHWGLPPEDFDLEAD